MEAFAKGVYWIIQTTMTLAPYAFVIAATIVFVGLMIAREKRIKTAKSAYKKALKAIRRDPTNAALAAAALAAGRAFLDDATIRNDIDAARGRL